MVQAHPGAQREDSRKAILSFCLYSVVGFNMLGWFRRVFNTSTVLFFNGLALCLVGVGQ